MPIGVALIGAGPFGRRHASALSALAEARQVVVCDLKEDRARETAQSFGFARWTTNLEDVSADPSVGAVIVASQEDAHRGPACTLLEAGKHVLVEKPIATDVADALAMIQTAMKVDRLLEVGHVLHFEPAYALLRERLHRGELGRPVSLLARRHCRKTSFQHYSRTHPFLHLGVHDLDLMLWMLAEPLEVKRAWERNTLGRANPDVGWVALESPSGVLCQVEVSWLLPGNSPAGIVAELEIIGSEGTAQVRSPAPTLALWTDDGVETPDTAIWPDLAGATAGALQDEVRHFLRRALEGGPYDWEGAERATQALALALQAVKQAPFDLAQGVVSKGPSRTTKPQAEETTNE